MSTPPPAALAVARLVSRAVIAVSGPDWKSFLQGLLTQDVETIAPGELRFSGLLTPQGKLLYDLFVAGTEDGALLDVAAQHRAAILTRRSLFLNMRRPTRPASAPFQPLVFSSPFGPGTVPGALCRP